MSPHPCLTTCRPGHCHRTPCLGVLELRESTEGGPEGLSVGLGGMTVGGVGEGVSEKVFPDSEASTLAQGGSGRVCQVDKCREGVSGRRNRQRCENLGKSESF